MPTLRLNRVDFMQGLKNAQALRRAMTHDPKDDRESGQLAIAGMYLAVSALKAEFTMTAPEVKETLSKMLDVICNDLTRQEERSARETPGDTD